MSAQRLATLLAIVSFAVLALPAGAARTIGGGYTAPSPVNPPPSGEWRGSYITSRTIWGDGIEHTNENGFQFNIVHYVYGLDQQSCHNALVAAINASNASHWTACAPY